RRARSRQRNPVSETAKGLLSLRLWLQIVSGELLREFLGLSDHWNGVCLNHLPSLRSHARHISDGRVVLLDIVFAEKTPFRRKISFCRRRKVYNLGEVQRANMTSPHVETQKPHLDCRERFPDLDAELRAVDIAAD